MSRLRKKNLTPAAFKVKDLEIEKCREFIDSVKERRIVILELSDDQSFDRLKWVLAARLLFELHIIKKTEKLDLKIFSKNYDVIIISCGNEEISSELNDDIIKLYRNKPKIVITGGSTPESRATLLRSGFDDVIDIRLSDGLEFISRIACIDRRYRLTREALAECQNYAGEFMSLCPHDNLNRKQKLLLRTMVNAPDRTVSSIDLCRVLSDNPNPITDNHLKVLLTQTRKKLRPEVKIVSLTRLGKGSGGYHLQLSN